MLEPDGVGGDPGLARGPEHLLEVVALAGVDDVEHEIRTEFLDPQQDGGEIGGAVEKGTV